MTLPQVIDKDLIILANKFLNATENGTFEEFVMYLRDTGEGDFKFNGNRYKDAKKGYCYVKYMKYSNTSEDKWFLHSKPVYPTVAHLEIESTERDTLKRNYDDNCDYDLSQTPIKQYRSTKSPKSSNYQDEYIKDYFKNFISFLQTDEIEELLPFSEKLSYELTEHFNQAQITKLCRILIKGNTNCGKSTFIEFIAKKLNFHYVMVNLSCIPQFSSINFWIAVTKYIENYDKVLFHFDFNLCTSKFINNFKLKQPRVILSKVVIVYECTDDSEINNWFDCQLNFPQTKKVDRKRIFEYFLKSSYLGECLTFDMLADWTPGFEIGDIYSITEIFKRSYEVSKNINKDTVENIIRTFKLGKAQFNHCVEDTGVNWHDIGGHEKAIEDLKNLTNELNNENGNSKGNGVLLYGPPGCGKTTLAKALSTELKFNFISVCCTDILSKFQGESEKNVTKIFNKARNSEPCILFFDEIDALCSQRDTDNNGSKNNIVNVFLTQLDGMHSHKNSKILILGATNFKNQIDVAITRSGRLGRHIEISLPKSPQQRISVLMASSKGGTNPPFLNDNNVEDENRVDKIFTKISQDEYTEGWNHADLAELINCSEKERSKTGDQFILMKHVYNAYCEMNKGKKSPDFYNFDKDTEIFLLKDLQEINFEFEETMENYVNYVKNRLFRRPKGLVELNVGGLHNSGKTTFIKLIAKNNNLNLITLTKEFFNKFNANFFWKGAKIFQDVNGQTMFHIIMKSLSEEVILHIKKCIEKFKHDDSVIIVYEENKDKCGYLTIPLPDAFVRERYIKQKLAENQLLCDTNLIEKMVLLTEGWVYGNLEKLGVELEGFSGSISEKDMLSLIE